MVEADAIQRFTRAARTELSADGVDPITDEEPNGVRELHYHPAEFGGVYTVLTAYTRPGFPANEL